MAQLKNSPLQGLRGTLGDLVFRTYNGKTIVSIKPEKPRKLSAAQKAACTRFSQAAQQATILLMNAAMREYYEHEALRLNLPNAYTAALRDQMLNTKLRAEPVSAGESNDHSASALNVSPC